MTDKQLVSKFLETRNEQAFIDLYEINTPALYQLALRFTDNSKSDAEDLIQQMWYVAIKKLDTFEWRSQLKTWLTGILINLWKENEKRVGKEMLMYFELEDNPSDVLEDEIPKFNAIDLEKAISKLPPGYKQVIILHDIEGYRHKEISVMMDISEGTSKSQLFRARKAMRMYLIEARTL